MRFKISFLFVLHFIPIFTFSQSLEKDILAGKSILIQSEVMNDEREIQVFLPENYLESDDKFQVLYILDGQRYFFHGVSIQKSFLDFKQSPEFIIVGISKKRSDRNRIYSIDSEKYLSFIEKEIINIIDTKYRTSNKRILFGWAYAGSFVIEALIKKPKLFDTYIAASPYPLENKMKRLDSLLTDPCDINPLLFVASETNEGVVQDGIKKLDSLLTNNATSSSNWTYKKLDEEEHRSTAFTTLYHGIKKHFEYYPEIQFSNLDEFREAGGLLFVKNYYKHRAERFGFSSELTDWTMFSLTRNAMRADDYIQFDIFVKEFITSGFLTRLRINRACSIAQFYLKKNQNERAAELFILLYKKHPNSEVVLRGLGDTYKAMGALEKAKEYYKKAKKIKN